MREEANDKGGLFRPVPPLVSDSDRQDTRAQGSCMAHTPLSHQHG